MGIHINRLPDYIRLVTETEKILLSQEGGCFSYGDVRVRTEEEDNKLRISLTAGETPVRFVVCRFNGSWEKDYCFLGDALERGYGNLKWEGMDPQRIMPWYFMASCEKETLGYGVRVRPSALAFWMCDREGITLWLDTRSGAKGVVLEGRELEIACLIERKSKEGQSSFSFMKDFCNALSNQPVFPKAPVYGSNNWYYAYGNSSEEMILKDAALLAELTEGLENRPYMVIDDCWQELALTKGAAGRPYERGNVRFPDMKGLADKMRGMGVRPGIWIRPLETNEMFLKDSLRSERNRNAMDISVPEVLEMIGEDVRRVAGWGYELIKYDFATFDFYGDFYSQPLPWLKQEGWGLKDRSKTSAEVIKDLYRVIYENAGEAVLIGCNVIGHLASGYIHLHRSGDDTSGHSYDRSIMMGVNTLCFRMGQHKNFFHIDADCVGITSDIEWEDNKKFLDLLSLSGTPLFISIDPCTVTEEIKSDLKKAFLLASEQRDELVPMDWMHTTIPEKYMINGEEKNFCWMRPWGLDSFSSL